MARFVIRLDDICPTMDHEKFARARRLFEAAGVRPLLGVVPDNQDPDLQIDPPDPDFWEDMRTLQKSGWGISQHGYQHKIHTAEYGLLGISPRSEFSGRSYDRQRNDLAKGQTILTRVGISTVIFMAPFHSYDSTTLKALKDLGFARLTDGYGLYPWKQDGLTFVPQLFERPVSFGMGIYTMCLHTSNMQLNQIDALGRFVAENSTRFIGFDQASEHVWPKVVTKPLEMMFRSALMAKRRLQ